MAKLQSMMTRNQTAYWLPRRAPRRTLRAFLLRMHPTLAVAALLVTVPGCGRQAPPEPPPPVERSEARSRPPEPERRLLPTRTAALEGIFETKSEAAEVGEGFTYKNERIRSAPWSVNVVKIDRSRSDLQLTTTLGRGKTIGLSPLTEQLDRLPSDLGQPVAAINGDFYRTEHERYAGDPRGLQIAQGELISAPSGKDAFWIDADGDPHMGAVTSQRSEERRVGKECV